MVARKGWWTRNSLPWVKRSASFGLSVTPTLGFDGAVSTVAAAMGLSVTPSLGMDAAVRHTADFGLTVTPELTFGTGKPASFGLSVTPTLSMDAVARVPASFGLAVTPSLGMDAALRIPVGVGLSVAPSIGMSAKVTTTYASFPTVPTGTVNVAINSGAGAVQASSNTLQEGNCNASNGPYHSAAVLPDSMATDLYSVAVTVGALSGAASDRHVGAGVFSADGTVGVMTFWPAASGGATIHSRVGGTFTERASRGSSVANSGDVIKLVPTVSGGVVTWTVHLNGVPTSLSWVDSGHVADLPGRHPATVYRRVYVFPNQYPSRGVAALTAADI
ncbi:hypothetical protein FZI85_25220 [Mycobacterium sp. CBMA293]|uniref:hypothetical protein n=1 Tax=unclassified Mycolicibacterium TaxID=2636767 RepID=UPI0012DD4EC9|nr:MULTISPECIES: hypothetical protein [unclassified Mycolicibacterium]MUL47617.1 hypothetical protein [Mycolicibacterium sp. CBMA 360]MUL61865.1 hypothetical protein [Mycolicibacterium sp. CBMA 335]MUL68938.1 hypothetical protein [Mycolicibacterium sp. CBMA 311]MUL92845.1 hypothetical protein [Mycolicibacterium sp. CBMA 230]MUM08712.1 hypothetical protein [Mycolicibacterium sp. CBMA 213]